MEKIRRKIFFWALALAFMVIAPAIVMHTRGYRFDIGRGVFVYSGSISLKTNPQNITVKLNNEITESKKLNMINSSYNISGLLPGEYSIEISGDRFNAWSKKIDVHSGLASEFWNIILIKENYEKIENQASAANQFYISPKSRFIACARQDSDNLSLGVYDIDRDATNENYAIADSNLAALEIEENIEWSPDESYLSVPVRKKEDLLYDYMIINRDSGQISSLTELSGKEAVTDVRWDPLQKGFLFFLNENNLYRFNVQDNAISAIALEVSCYDISRSAVYFAKIPNNLIFKNVLDGSQNPVQLTNQFPGPENASILKITAYDDSRLALLTKDEKDLYIFNKGEHDAYFKKLAKNIEGTHFSNDGKKLLFWDGYEISVYFLRDWNVQPVRTENEMQNITRYSEPVKNVQWFKDYEHVIFNSGRWIKIIELDPRDRRNSSDIANTEMENPLLVYSNFLEKLYFTDKKEDGNGIYSINFPEPAPILGIGGA